MAVEFRFFGAKRADAKIRKIQSAARGKYAQEAVDVGYRTAHRLAPVYTGATRNAIRWEKGKRSAKLELIQPQQDRTNPRPYHLWMHNIGKYKLKGHITSGYGNFMWIAKEDMKNYMIKRINKRFNNAK